MGLLTTLGLPKPKLEVPPTTRSGEPDPGPLTTPGLQSPMPGEPDAPTDPWPGASIALYNASGKALELDIDGLSGDELRFESEPADRLEPGMKTQFRVVPQAPGVTTSAGFASYKVKGEEGSVVTFLWNGKLAQVKVEGAVKFTSAVSATPDAAKGDQYLMALKDPAQAPQPPHEPPGQHPPEQPPVQPPQQPQQPQQPTAEPVRLAKVSVVNRAGFALRFVRSHLDGEAATFAPAPPDAIAGERTGTFQIRSDDAAHPEIGGFADYELILDHVDPKDGDGKHTLKLAWSSSEWGASVSPPAEGLDVKKGGSVHDFVFTVTGPEPSFEPPAKANGEPTLRAGDQSNDGWVEYLQELLSVVHRVAGLKIDGIFGSKTLAAVRAFQRRFKKEGVLEDGVVGDQTWSYLRRGAPKKVATDGRKPHSYTEKGDEARWVTERGGFYLEPGNPDLLHAWVASVGNSDAIAGRLARFRIVSPDGRKKVFDQPIGKAGPAGKNGQGAWHEASVLGFATMFDADGPHAGTYQVTAFLPADLGGDVCDSPLEVKKKD